MSISKLIISQITVRQRFCRQEEDQRGLFADVVQAASRNPAEREFLLDEQPLSVGPNGLPGINWYTGEVDASSSLRTAPPSPAWGTDDIGVRINAGRYAGVCGFIVKVEHDLVEICPSGSSKGDPHVGSKPFLLSRKTTLI